MKMMEPNADNFKLIEQAISNIDKKYGKGSTFILDSNQRLQNVDVIPTGSIALNNALVVGGLPKGRIVEFFGPEMSGKSSLALQCVAEAQKLGILCAYIDAEHALDIAYSKSLGVKVNELIVCQPDYGEMALDVAEELIQSNNIGVIVIDSVAALVPKAELEGEMGQAHMGLQARLMSQALRKLTGIVAKSNSIIIFINQLRCIEENTLLLINNKLTKIKNCSKGDFISDKEIKETINTGEVSGVELLFKYRPSFKISDNHEQPIISDGKYQTKKGTDISNNDWVIQPIINKIELGNHNNYVNLKKIVNNVLESQKPNSKKVDFPLVLDEDLAFVLGTYYSDGSFKEYDKNKDYGIQWGEKNEERYNLIKDFVSKVFPNCNSNSKNRNIQLNGKSYLDYFKLIGMKRYGINKDIPETIMNSPKSVIVSFLRGVFFDTHNFFNYGFIFTNGNNESILQISTILYYFGIFADIRNKNRKDYRRGHNQLHITGVDALKFRDLIGFAEPSKQNSALKFEKYHNSRGKTDTIPYLFALNIFNIIKGLKLKGLSKAPKYNNIKMCLFKKLNVDRNSIIEFINYFDTKLEEITNIVSLLKSNRFVKVNSINKNITFNAIDIMVDKNSLFTASQYLTHNSKIGITWGSNETTPGGKALKFYASIRIDIRKTGHIKDGSEIIGNHVKVKVVKNKVAAPFKEAEFDLIFGKGIDKLSEIIDLAVERKIIDKSGAWYSYKGERLGQGKEQSKTLLSMNPDMVDEITKQIYTLEPVVTKSTNDDDSDLDLGDIEIGTTK